MTINALLFVATGRLDIAPVVARRVTMQFAKRRIIFFEGAKCSNKVLRQTSKADDIYHAFPKSVDGYATRFG